MEKIKKEAKIIGKFSLVGAFNAALAYTLISTFMMIGMTPRVSNALSYIIGFFVSFFLRKRFVYQSNKKVLPELLKFTVVFVFGYILNLIVLSSLLYLGLNPYLCQFFAIGTYIGSSYTLSRKWVFNVSKDAGR